MPDVKAELKTPIFKREARLDDSLARPFQVDEDLVNRINAVPGLSWETSLYEDMWNTDMSVAQAKAFQGQFVPKTAKKNLKKLRFRPLKNSHEAKSQEKVRYVKSRKFQA